jgi:4-aminobutyrate aminotransferase-like enzyme
MDRVLRFVPPLVITQADIDRLLDILPHLIPTTAQTGHH